MQNQSRLTSLAAFLVFAVFGCSSSSDPSTGTIDVSETNGTVRVYVVNYPLKYFAERIGSDHVHVVFPVPPDVDPAFWVPDAATIVAYQQAEVILLNGAAYARWTKSVSLPESKLVDTTEAVVSQYITIEDAVTHIHGPGGDHAHTGTAFTTWLDPRLAIAQAEAIKRAFVQLRPQYEEEFQANFDALRMELNNWDQELGAVVEGKSERPLLFSHPVYQYLERRYNLNAQSVHWEPDEVPSAKQWEELTAILERHSAKWIVWEGAPIDANAERLEAMGLQSTVYEPCGNQPVEGDFLDAMRRNTSNLREVFAD